MTYITTPRLLLRDWRPEDLPPLRRMNLDPEVMEFFPKLTTIEETDDLFNKIQNEHAHSGYGLYAVEQITEKAFIGFIGFHLADFPTDFTPAIEIGWRLKKAVWGQGLATEGAAACLKYGLENLGFEEIISFTSKINIRSQRVMKKIGMRYEREFSHPDIDPESPLCPHLLYRV